MVLKMYNINSGIIKIDSIYLDLEPSTTRVPSFFSWDKTDIFLRF